MMSLESLTPFVMSSSSLSSSLEEEADGVDSPSVTSDEESEEELDIT